MSAQTRTAWWRSVAIAGVVALIMLTVAGCGQRGAASDDSGDSGSSGGGPTVGLVTDQGGLGDRSFNALANKGLEQAEAELGAEGKVLESKAASDYEKNLGELSKQKLDLIIGVGFLMSDPIKNVSAKAPEQPYAIIDFPVSELGSPKNVRGLLFREEEAGYLAGTLAGLAEQEGTLKGLNGAKVVSVVGGQKIPPVDKYIAGFEAGVKSQCKGCKVLVDYTQNFQDQAKCQDAALAQISKGSDIIFQVAGGCGLGALDAAKSKGVWGIGVDADQAYLGPHILTSAMKRVDVATFETIKSIKDGSFEGGADTVFGLAEGGVGLGEIAAAAKKYEAQLTEVQEQIKAGKIEIPTTVS